MLRMFFKKNENFFQLTLIGLLLIKLKTEKRRHRQYISILFHIKGLSIFYTVLYVMYKDLEHLLLKNPFSILFSILFPIYYTAIQYFC